MVSAKSTADNYRSTKIAEDQVRVNNFTSNGNLYMVGRRKHKYFVSWRIICYTKKITLIVTKLCKNIV